MLNRLWNEIARVLERPQLRVDSIQLNLEQLQLMPHRLPEDHSFALGCLEALHVLHACRKGVKEPLPADMIHHGLGLVRDFHDLGEHGTEVVYVLGLIILRAALKETP